MQLHWSHAVLLVRDMEEMIDFYSKVLGFEVTDRGPFPAPDAEGAEIVFLSQVDTDHHQIAFVDKKRDGNPPNPVDHFAFRVDSLGEVKEIIAPKVGDLAPDFELPAASGDGVARRPSLRGRPIGVLSA